MDRDFALFKDAWFWVALCIPLAVIGLIGVGFGLIALPFLD